eukprot:gene506-10185_t
MAVVEEFVKKIDKKLGFLSYLNEETEQIMQRKDQKEIERQSRVYETKVDEIQELKIQIQELKLEEGEIPSEVKKWRIGIEERLKEFQPIAAGMKEIIESFKHDAKKKEQEVDLELERQKFEQRLQLEAKLVELKGRSLVREKPVTAVKLPKLSITKFKGTHIDWFRFWNQFETEVDKQNLDPVTKFNYLKEFIEPKVRINIENLIHNGEGYERAKQILKSKYGRPSEVINAHVQCIIELPVIRGSNPHKIHDFFNKLLPSVQALESLGRLKSISGYTRLTLDKLEGIRADLVRLDDQWQEWGFPQLIEALSKWTERNPLTQSEGRDRMFTTRNSNYLPRSCVYCEHENHKSSECKKVVKVSERREILRQKRLCFNCTSSGHKASVCTSKGSCRNCRGKHHTSVCDKVEKQGDVLLVTGEQGVVHPVVIVKVEGVLCRALLDTGAGSSYVSSQLIEKVAKQPIKREQRQIDMMMSTKIAKIEIYNLRVESKDQSFSLNLDVSKVNRKELLTVPNPNYGEMTKKFSHLKGVYMEERSDKEALPIHLIIGASDYAKIKTPTKPRVGKPGEPVAELTGFGWTIMSPGYEIESNNMFFAKSALADFDKLCSLDVLGIQDKAEKDIVIQDFKDQLERSPEGWYRTGLLWKSEIPDLPDNEQGSKSRLKRLVQRLERQPELYDNQSPFLLCATVKKHLEECRAEFPEEVSEIERSIYVDDLLLGGSSITEVQKLKESAIEIFDSAKFTLHKLHSNRKELETDDADTDTELEAKPVKEILKVGREIRDVLTERILEKYSFLKAMKVTAWLKRFAINSRLKKIDRRVGPLTTAELQDVIAFWIRKVQGEFEVKLEFKETQKQLGLEKDEREIYVCKGRIQGEYPIFLPTDVLFSEKLVSYAHLSTHCGGSSLTMAKVREDYWIPRLRKLAKGVIKKGNTCKRFNARPVSKPKPGLLPEDRTEGTRPFEVVGVDYAGPISHKTRKGEKENLTRAVYMEVVPDTTAKIFLQCLKRFTARRGRPKKIYSDNAQTFKFAAKWLKQLMKDEEFHDFLREQSIKWQFNLSKAPWWGGQYERIIGLTKQVMYRILGKAKLSYDELQEMMLDVEITLNNRPLSYIEDDVQMPLLTPNMMLLSHQNALLESEVCRVQDRDLRKRARYLQKCRDNLWKRWKSEYMRSLRERHNLKCKDGGESIEEGKVVLIKGDERNRGEWNIGIVDKVIQGKDGVVRGARLRTGKTKIERAVQLLYPLEIDCDVPEKETKKAENLNPQAKEFRPQRRAAQIAKSSVKETFAYEDKELEDD